MKQPSRRDFGATTGLAATGLVTGFALAGGPVRAEAILTDADGLEASEVSIKVADGTIPGYRARPKDAVNAPTILVVQEVFGVHEHIRDLCRRFAKQGYYAIAPSLYARQGDPAKYDMDSVQKLVSEVVSKVPDGQVMADLDATTAFAGEDSADIARLGITGFCWGGRITWLYAAHSKTLKAGVAWYGALTGEKTPQRPLHPLDKAAELNAPVLGLYGGLDKGIPVSDVEAMRKALAEAGKTNSRIDIFADAQHGFFADYRPSYNEKDAKEAWTRCLSWFKQNGV